MVQFTNNEGERNDAPLICECEFERGHHTGCYFPSVLSTNSVWLLKRSSDSLLGPVQAPVVRKVDSASGFPDTYPMDSHIHLLNNGAQAH